MVATQSRPSLASAMVQTRSPLMVVSFFGSWRKWVNAEPGRTAPGRRPGSDQQAAVAVLEDRGDAPGGSALPGFRHGGAVLWKAR